LSRSTKPQQAIFELPFSSVSSRVLVSPRAKLTETSVIGTKMTLWLDTRDRNRQLFVLSDSCNLHPFLVSLLLIQVLKPTQADSNATKAPSTMQCAGGIWKGKFHSENISNAFRPHYAGEIWKSNNCWSFCICVCRNLGLGNNIIIVAPSFTKTGSVFEMFSFHTKTKSRRFQISPVSRAFSESFFSTTDSLVLDGKPNRRIKLRFHIPAALCCEEQNRGNNFNK